MNAHTKWSDQRVAAIMVVGLLVQAIPLIFAQPLISAWLHQDWLTAWGFIFAEGLIFGLPPFIAIGFAVVMEFERYKAVPILIVCLSFGIFIGNACRWNTAYVFTLAKASISKAHNNSLGTNAESSAEQLLHKIRANPSLLKSYESRLEQIANADTSRKGVIEFVTSAQGLPDSKQLVTHVAGNGMVTQSNWDHLYHLVLRQALQGNNLAQSRIAMVAQHREE